LEGISMGFYITGDYEKDGFIYEKVNELKQHINLSEYAWQIIGDDIRNFYVDDTKESFSGFLNTIFTNYYQTASSTISQRFIEKSDELTKLFSGNEFKKYNNDITNVYISKMLDEYENQLIQLAFSYPKGIGRKFRINKENLDILRDSLESIHYNDSVGLYMKAIFEEYATKSTHERECIFFKKTIDTINLAISGSNQLKISILQKLSITHENFYTRKFYVSPYKVVQDKNMGFNYLIGYTEEILMDGKKSPKHISSFRLNRIDKINVMSSMSGFISKADKEKIETSIIEKGPQFMAGDLIEITIVLSNKGIESYNRQIYMRPQYTSKENNIYHFKCTEVQALNYFFKFGRDVQITEPLSLRDKFINRYEDALKAYKKG
jgi:hypothetical protein